MINFFKEKVFPKSISKKEATDTGMAMTLICLLLGAYLKNNDFYIAAIATLVVAMAFPMLYHHLRITMLWFGLTNLLGMVLSKVLLSVVYILFLMPVGMIRRTMGKDSLNLKGFKKGRDSVMITRDIEFTANDIKNPF